jgi:hypothetical protein
LESAIALQFSSLFEVRVGLGVTGEAAAQIEQVEDQLVKRHKRGAMFLCINYSRSQKYLGDQIGDGTQCPTALDPAITKASPMSRESPTPLSVVLIAHKGYKPPERFNPRI